MTARSRTRDLRLVIGGSYWNYLTGTKNRNVPQGLRDWTTDVTGNFGGDNPLEILHWQNWAGRLTGTYRYNNQVLRVLTNYPVTYLPDPKSTLSKWPIPSQGDKTSLCWQILARSNPSRPIVSVPTFLGELRDLPGLLKDFGDSLLRMVAGGHLSWRWAIKPMVSDMWKILTFTRLVNQRFKWIRELSQGRTLKRRVQLGRDELYETQPNVLVETNTCTIKATRCTLYAMKHWGTCNWKVALNDLDLLPIDVASQYDLAKRILLGWTGWEVLAATWELIPWSWLVDWYVNVGDFIASGNNTIPATPTNICYMRTCSAKSTYVITEKPSWVRLDGPYMEIEEHKLRVPLQDSDFYATAFPSLPALTSGQWSILASLAVLKAKPWSVAGKLLR